MAQQRLQTLNTISNIVGTDKNLNLGFGSETSLKVKMALEQAGFDFGDLSGSQLDPEAKRRAGVGILQVVQHQADAIRVQDVPGEQPRPCLDEKGNVRMLGILSQNAKREADLGKLARQNQDNWSNWDNVVEKYDQEHPIKDPTTGKVLSNHSIIAPANLGARGIKAASDFVADKIGVFRYRTARRIRS
jgi:hypothetical protein